MEVNALTRWMSIGKNLSSLGKLEDELDRMERGLVNKERKSKGLPISPSLQQLLEQEGWLIQGGQLVRRQPPIISYEILTPDFLRRSFRRFGKGFLIGWGGRSILNLLVALAKARRHPNKLVEAVKESLNPTGQPVRYGAFLGWVLSVFETVMRITQHKNFELDNNTRSLLAGALAGAGVMFIPKDMRVHFALFFFVRACEVLAYNGVQHGVLPHIAHGDTLTMMVASAQVIWAWWATQPAIEPSYLHFLDHQSGIPRAHHPGLTELQFTGALSQRNKDIANEWRATQGMAPLEKWPTTEAQFHQLIHSGSESCIMGFIRFIFFGGLKRALPVYLPVHVIPTLVFNTKKLLTQPGPVLTHILVNVGRSSLFLASYCGACWLMTCYAWSYGFKNHFIGALAGAAGGAMVLIEKKSRRIELGLYVMTQAIYSFYHHWYLKGIFPRIPNYEIWICSFSLAILMHAYVNDPLLLRKTYFGLLKFAFGSGAQLLGLPAKHESSGSPRPKDNDKANTNQFNENTNSFKHSK